MTKQQQIEKLDAQRAVLIDGIADLQCYLSSDKFADDTTVQTADVLRRLRDITLAYLDVEV
jgi:hypothetical protein